MKSWFSKKDRLLAGTIIAGVSALGMAGAAQAQDAEEEIVVTGSRIPQPNLVSVSPVTQVGSEEIANRGVTRIEDMINQLPQAYGAQGSNVSNSASGTATADLRGLGSNRTLVLVNSRRMVAGDPAASTGYSADLNMIPASLVERVEVLTGGASAVYGADAVAGVVNFILQDDFEGARFDAEYSFYQSDNSNDEIGDLAYYESILPQFFRIPDDNVSDGEQYGFSAVFGANTEDGRGNVTVYADYRNINAVLQGERGFSACSFGSGATYSCAGSSTSFPIQVAPATQVANYARGPYIPLPGTRQQVDLDGSLTGSNTYLYNFGASNYYQRPDERYALGGFAHYEINPQIELYAELMFMDDRSIAQIAPSGIFVGSGLGSISGNYVVNCDNPFLTPELVDLICNSDAVPDEYENIGDDTDEDGTTDRDEAIARVIAGGDNPLTPEDESDPVQAAALVDGSLGLQPTCADPTPGGVDDPDTPQNEAANEAICVTQLRVRNVNGGNRQADLRHTQYRIVLGARGELATGWDYDVYGAYNTTIYQQHYLNEYSLSRVNRALINYGGECGVNVDDNPANNDPACVPLDVFDQFGPDQSQLSYITASGQMQGTTTLSMASGVITGDLGQWGLTSPGAEDSIGVAFGVEARSEELDLRPDSNFCPSNDDSVVSDLLGQGATTCPTNGTVNVVELFGEANIPLLQEVPFFYSLGLDLGYRYSDYNVSGGNEESSGNNSFTTDTYKIGGHWAPVEDIRFRGAYQRASRAPNIIELFAPQQVALAGTVDPCAGATPGATLAECQLTGVTAGQYGFIESNPAFQYNGLLSGTATLTPEVADTITLGFIFTPTFLPGLSVSLDWYNIQIEEKIGTIGQDFIITRCIETANPFFCDRINRDSGGSLWLSPAGYVVDLNDNNGEMETTGVDVEANYRFELASLGGFGVNYQASWLEEYLITPPQSPTFDCAGRYGPTCSGSTGNGFGVPLPEYRHKVRLDWDTPITGISLSGSWRFYGEVTLDEASAAASGSPATDMTLDSRHYFDVSASWDLWDSVTLRAGVNNVMDEDPPLTGASNCPSGPCNGNTWPQLYDTLGRYFFFGATADF